MYLTAAYEQEPKRFQSVSPGPILIAGLTASALVIPKAMAYGWRQNLGGTHSMRSTGRVLILFPAVLAATVSAFAQKPAWEPAPGCAQMKIWPDAAPAQPGSTATSAPEADTTTAKDNLIAGKPLIRLGNVSTPTITLYRPSR